MQVSVSASACGDARLASRAMSCRRLPVFDSVAALLITQRTSANGGVPAKLLSRPFCLISRATNRLRTSTRSSSPLLMSVKSTRIGFASCPRHTGFICHFLKGIEHFVPLQLFHTIPPEINSNDFGVFGIN